MSESTTNDVSLADRPLSSDEQSAIYAMRGVAKALHHEILHCEVPESESAELQGDLAVALELIAQSLKVKL